MRVSLFVFCLLAVQQCLLAGTNDYWQVSFRACDSTGWRTQFNCDCATTPAASDDLDSYDKVVTSVNPNCAWAACYDLGLGYGMGYHVDWRKSIEASSKTWNIKIRVGSNWTQPEVYLRVWNPAGTFDINGTIPIALKVASDPTGTYQSGAVLIPQWDPSKNGNQTAPAYTFVFSNAGALVGGAAVHLQLIAGGSAPIPCSIGEARTNYVGQLVLISAVTAFSGSEDFAGLWVASDGLPGLRVSPGLGVGRREVVDLTGIVNWTDGVPILTNAQLVARRGTLIPPKHALSVRSLANDRRESLEYTGINVVGTLCVVCGEVTAVDSSSSVFYVEDGSGVTDGLGPANAPYKGIRVLCGNGVSLPQVGDYVRAAGVRSVEKHILERDTVVNGEWRSEGETVYVPVILIRDAQDILTLLP